MEFPPYDPYTPVVQRQIQAAGKGAGSALLPIDHQQAAEVFVPGRRTEAEGSQQQPFGSANSQVLPGTVQSQDGQTGLVGQQSSEAAEEPRNPH